MNAPSTVHSRITPASTRATVLDMLSVNQVVKDKVEQECDGVHSRVTACLADGAGKGVALDELKAERGWERASMPCATARSNRSVPH
jgi:hypothetical protein